MREREENVEEELGDFTALTEDDGRGSKEEEEKE